MSFSFWRNLLHSGAVVSEREIRGQIPYFRQRFVTLPQEKLFAAAMVVHLKHVQQGELMYDAAHAESGVTDTTS